HSSKTTKCAGRQAIPHIGDANCSKARRNAARRYARATQRLPPSARALGQRCCFIATAGALLWSVIGRGEKKHGGGSVMELRTASPRKYDHTRPVNLCAQCGETIFLPEWSEYLDRHRVRHLWECEAGGYKFETLISFPEP